MCSGRKHEKTQQKILDAAISLFLQGDYDQVSIEKIAREAGVSKGAIFHYYPTKAALAFDAVKHLFDEFEKRLNEETENRSLGPEGYLEAYVYSSLKMEVEEKGLTKFLLTLVSRADFPEAKELVGIMEIYLEKIAMGFAELGVENPELKARLLWALLDGLGIQFFIEDSNMSDDETVALAKEIVNLFLK